jgi:hypothetical protein
MMKPEVTRASVIGRPNMRLVIIGIAAGIPIIGSHFLKVDEFKLI